MEIIEKITEWARTQPFWQRVVVGDMLRGKKFSDDDITRFAKMALDEAIDPESLAEKNGNPLEEFDYTCSEPCESVVITGLSDTVNINAIRDGSSCTFNERGLNIIYGNNAAGKSGYTRILKNACMSRHSEKVCGSIYRIDGAVSSATITYKHGDLVEPYFWSGAVAANSNLKTVNVFDGKSGQSYLTGQTDIKYKPAGMDVLDGLVDVVQRVGAKLVEEGLRKKEQLTNLDVIFADFEGTKAFQLIKDLDKRGALEEFECISVLTDAEVKELERLKSEIPERERVAPAKYREILLRTTNRLGRIADVSTSLVESLKKDNQENIDKSIKLARDAEKVAEIAKKTKFDEKYLTGTGGQLWKVMWAAAGEFSSQQAYTEHKFPHTQDGSKCPLCQQDLADDAAKRLKSFERYISDKSQENAKTLGEARDKLIKVFTDICPKNDSVDLLFSEVGVEDYPEIANVRIAIDKLIKHHDRYLDAIKSGNPIIENLDLSKEIESITQLSAHIKSSRLELDKPLDDKQYIADLTLDKQKMKGLSARKLLSVHEKSIKTNISVLSLLAYNKSAQSKCVTTPISLQSGRLSSDYIVARLKDNFNDELGKIFSSQIKAELVSAPTRQGVPHSEIILTSNGIRSREKIESIMSEGEQRGLALAGFFTELSMIPYKSAIIFDDPITSMDDDNAYLIARRLVEAAKERQVIVFTHRVTFVTLLADEAKTQGVLMTPKTVTKLSQPGIIEDQIHWDARKIKERLGWLNNNINAVLKPLYRDNKASEYQEKGQYFYVRLRETWERAIEERLFGDVVKRHSRNVSTQQMKDVKYRETDDAIIEENMSRCSTLAAHDTPPETVTPIPGIDIIEADLKKLTNWLDEINKR